MAKNPFRPRNGSYKQIINQATRRVGTLPVVFYDKIPKDLRSLAFTISGIERMSTIQKVLEDLNKSFENNETFEQWQESFNIDDLANLSDARRSTVYRTFMTTEYNRGRLEVAYDNNDLNYMRYQAILDDRTRPNHAANDGITRKVDDPFWNTNLPPLGYNCRCFVLNLDKEDAGKVTPKSKTESESVKPDDGWSYNKVEPVKDLTKYYRDKAKIFNETLKEASLNRLMLRNQDNELWYEKNKNVFTKPENDK